MTEWQVWKVAGTLELHLSEPETDKPKEFLGVIKDLPAAMVNRGPK